MKKAPAIKPAAKGASKPSPGAHAGFSFDALRSETFSGVDGPSIVQRSNATGGERYEGQIAKDSGKRQGKGVLRWPNGNAYGGEWVDGAMCGDGQFFHAVEGDRYSGGFKDDKKHGEGKYTFANGNSYSGQFAFDKRHGTGRYSWMCGDEYDGEWVEGRMHGRGVTAYANGNKYIGEFVNDRREGSGRLSCTDGLAYDGEWLANNRHGRGRLDFPSGDFYVGEWQNDKKEGRGKDTFANGNSYDGEYKANTKHGSGIMTYNNGDVYDGQWAADKMDGEGTYTFANGFIYSGTWRADMRHGFGEYRFPNGHVYRGHWADDRRHGSGELFLGDGAGDNSGEVYRGAWVEGKMNGPFEVKDRDGNAIYAGEWRDGCPSGAGTWYVRAPLPGRDPDHVVLRLKGEYTAPAEGGKKGMGTIEKLPPELLQVIGAAIASTESSMSTPLPLSTSFNAPHVMDVGFVLNRERSIRTVSGDSKAEAFARVIREMRESQRPVHDAIKQVVKIAQSDLKHALDQWTATLGEWKKISGSEADPIAAAEASAKAAADNNARLAEAVALAEANAKASAARLAEAEAAKNAAAKRVDGLKQAVQEAKRRAQDAEAERREERAMASKIISAQAAAEAEEAAAAASEQQAQAAAARLADLGAATKAHDDEIAVLRRKVADAEKETQEAQRRARDATASHKEALKQIGSRCSILEAACAEAEKAAAAQDAEAESLTAAIEVLSKSEAARVSKESSEIATLEAARARANDELASLQDELDDTLKQTASIRNECAKKAEALAAAQKATAKFELQRALYAESLAEADAKHETLRAELARILAATEELKQRATTSTELQSIRSQLDREMLQKEAALKAVERAVAAETARAEQLRAALAATQNATPAPGTGSSAVGRLRQMRAQQSEPATPPTPEDLAEAELVANLEEQVRDLQRKIAKKREKMAKLQDEARSQASSWLPADEAQPTGASAVVASATKESLLNQIIKLRSQYERASKERDGLEAELAQLRQRSESADSDDANDAQDRDEERHIRDVIESIRASDRDWRVNYLLEQLAARRAMIADLQRDAAYARQLEKQVQAANSTISEYKSNTMPRSAGPKVPHSASSPMRALPPRRM
jgi:hypothetical protein